MLPGGTVKQEGFAIGDLPFGRALDEAIDLTKRHGWPAFAVGILPLLPISIGVGLFRTWVFFEEILPYFQAYALDFVWMSLYGGLIGAPLGAGMLYIFGTGYLGRAVSIREGFRHALVCWIKIAPIHVLLYALIYAGYNYLCYLPGILIITAVYLHLPVMSLERAGPITALGRNFGLMRGRVGVIFLAVLAQAMIQYGVYSVAYGTGSPYLGTAAIYLISAPISLYFNAVAVVLYISARSRHEAVDLQILADAIGKEAGEDDTRL